MHHLKCAVVGVHEVGPAFGCEAQALALAALNVGIESLLASLVIDDTDDFGVLQVDGIRRLHLVRIGEQVQALQRQDRPIPSVNLGVEDSDQPSLDVGLHRQLREGGPWKRLDGDLRLLHRFVPQPERLVGNLVIPDRTTSIGDVLLYGHDRASDSFARVLLGSHVQARVQHDEADSNLFDALRVPIVRLRFDAVLAVTPLQEVSLCEHLQDPRDHLPLTSGLERVEQEPQRADEVAFPELQAPDK
mmetsp:Transcript_12819/g.36852  ORF Transcript_12819/g.36852 Transcript_12819/m.36852 type:complete len:246 (-) Transcript_12819:1089-1826(-)